MSDIYKIGVALMLTQNGIAPALSAISHQLIGIHRSVGQINSGFGRWRTALLGAAGIMAGSGILGGLAKVAAYGEKFLDQQAKLQLLGMTNKQIAEATAKAWQNTRTAPGSHVADNLKSIGELFSIVGPDEALKTSGKFAQLDQLLHQVTGKEGAAYTTARASELLGVFTDKKTHQFDITGFDKFMDVIGRSAIATHGKVGPADWLAFAKQAGPAAGNLTDDGMLTITAIMQAMGGNRAGTAAAALNRQFAGGKMTQSVAEELMRLGIADKGDFKVGKGGHIIAKTDAMSNMVSALQHDPLDAISRIIVPALEKHGFNTNEKISGEIYRMIGTGPAQREIYELIRGRNQISAERERAKLAMPVGAGLNSLTANSPIAAKGAMTSAFDNMMAALGNQALKAAIPVMLELTKLFNNIGAFATAHPNAIAIIAGGLAALGAVLVAAGGVALLAAFGVGGGLAAGFAAAGAAVAAFLIYWDKLVAAINSIGSAVGGSTVGKWLGFGNGSSAAPPPANGAPPQVRGDVFLDKEKVGTAVWNYGNSLLANKPGSGSALFDPTGAASMNDAAFGLQ